MLSPKEIFDIAVKNEMEAAVLYTTMSKKTKDLVSKKMLEELAKDEIEHKVILEKLFSSKDEFESNFESKEKELDIKLSDYLSDVELKENSTMQETLIYAMKSEKKAFDFYNSLAELSSNFKVKDILRNLADIEMGHKNKLEKMYDDKIYSEN